ncbi:MAG: CopG family ribbon-helix-helix protein [Chloroflexota bacterium]
MCYNARIASTTFTLRLPSELKERLEQLAQAAGRSKAFLALDAVQRYVEMESWQIAEIRQAVKEADAGDFASGGEVEATVTRLTTER